MSTENFNNEENKINETNFIMVEQSKNEDGKEIWTPKQPRDEIQGGKKKGKGKILAVIAGGIVCAILGGAIGASGVYYFNRNSKNTLSNVKTLNSTPEFKKVDGKLTVSEVVKKVEPAVVTVSTRSIVQDVFGQQEQQGIGTGAIINEEGYIVTNYHVIEGANEVKVTLNGGKEVNAKIVNYDREQDLAVVKITDEVEIPGVAELGDSESVQAGDDVIAIGNPLGKEFAGSVTKGIVSSSKREIQIKNRKVTFIQTDAAINPGNSGGPLLNADGQIIGINVAKKTGEEIEGIGFAIPVNIVKDKIGELSKPILKLGIAIIDIDDNLAKEKGLKPGIYVKDVQEFSPAEKAGLKPGDIIIKADGENIKTSDELNKAKSKHNAGDEMKLVVIRDKKEIDIKLTLVE